MKFGDTVICIEGGTGLGVTEGNRYSITAVEGSFVAVIDPETGIEYGSRYEGDHHYPTLGAWRFRPESEFVTIESAGVLRDGEDTFTYDKLIDLLIDFNEFHDNIVEAVGNDEYLRGQVELIADAFPNMGVELGERIEMVRADIQRKLDDRHEDALTTERTIAGAKVVDALTELYVLVDSDEAMVGEMMYEIDKAARNNAQEV